MKPWEPQPPRFEVGQIKGRFEVKDYLGRSVAHPCGRVEHMYSVQCECGKTETVTQSALRRRNDCVTCAKRRGRQSVKQTFIPNAKLWAVPR